MSEYRPIHLSIVNAFRVTHPLIKLTLLPQKPSAQLGVQAQEPLTSCLNGGWLDFVQATTAPVSSWVQGSYHVQSILFCSGLPWTFCFIIFLSSLLQWSLNTGDFEWFRSSICGWVFRWYFLYFDHFWHSVLTTIHCTKKLFWWGLRGALIYSYGNKNLEVIGYYGNLAKQ